MVFPGTQGANASLELLSGTVGAAGPAPPDLPSLVYA